MTYTFTKLNNSKPDMIAAASKDARQSAQQIADDSGSVGDIKSATHGYFTITSRDGESGCGIADTPYKKVRLVTMVQYYWG